MSAGREAGLELGEAADVRGERHGGAAGDEGIGLPPSQRPRQLRLLDVVEPRGAAAQAGVGDRHECELPHLRQQAARRRGDALRVREVASIVGMSFLFLLIGIAFKNDVERR